MLSFAVPIKLFLFQTFKVEFNTSCSGLLSQEELCSSPQYMAELKTFKLWLKINFRIREGNLLES